MAEFQWEKVNSIPIERHEAVLEALIEHLGLELWEREAFHSGTVYKFKKSGESDDA